MSATYEPGTVAVATFNGESNVRVTRYATGLVSGWSRLTDPDDYLNDDDDEDGPRVTDVRPLVVIDPEDREQVERFIAALEDVSGEERHESTIGYVQHALRSLTRPPKPEVYEHLTAGAGDIAHALCGKVWAPNPVDAVRIVGRCPECMDLAESGWLA